MTRITQTQIANTTLNNLQDALGRISKVQQQMSSGRIINKPSDDPTGTVSALKLRGEIRTAEQYGRNSQDGLGWLSSADTALTQSSATLISIRNLTTNAANATQGSASSREALAAEMEGLRDHLLTLANTEYIDRPIFGGTTGGSQAFDATGAYVGDNGTVERRVGPGPTVRVDSSGEEAFGPNGATFTLVNDIINDIRTGAPGLSARLDQLKVAQDRVVGALAGVGARYGRVEQLQATADSNLLELKNSLSTIENVDLPAAYIELETQKVAYQSALGATARVIQPTLMDFLR